MVKNIWKSYSWTADKDVNESDPRTNVHYLGSSENKNGIYLLMRKREEVKIDGSKCFFFFFLTCGDLVSPSSLSFPPPPLTTTPQNL